MTWEIYITKNRQYKWWKAWFKCYFNEQGPYKGILKVGFFTTFLKWSFTYKQDAWEPPKIIAEKSICDPYRPKFSR